MQMIFTPVLSRSADLIVATGQKTIWMANVVTGYLAARPNYAPFTDWRIQQK
jgi:hypothetical protein